MTSRQLIQRRYRPWLESAGERPITTEQRKLVIATLCKAIVGFLPCTIIVADDRRERSWANGTWQTFLVSDNQPPCEIAVRWYGPSVGRPWESPSVVLLLAICQSLRLTGDIDDVCVDLKRGYLEKGFPTRIGAIERSEARSAKYKLLVPRRDSWLTCRGCNTWSRSTLPEYDCDARCALL